MKTAILAALACALVVTASAQERRKIDPLAIYGNWIGAPGVAPADCMGDGYVIAFGSVDGKKFLMTVQNRVGGIAPLNGKTTEYLVIAPPATAPASVEIFLSSKDAGDLGIRVKTGSSIELVPAGPDKTYPAASLVLKRC